MAQGREPAFAGCPDESVRDVLLIVRTPPPYGGGEAVGALLERLFTGTFGILAFRRPNHHKASQGRLTFANVGFGIRYVTRSTMYLLRNRPSVVYLDIPKDTTAFLRTSVLVLVARSLGIRVVGDLAGGDFVFLQRGLLVRRYGRWILTSVSAVRVLGESVATTLRSRGISNTVVISNGIEEPPNAGDGTHGDTTDGHRHFLYVGKIAPAKGISTLVDFVDEFRAEGEPFQLHVVGEWQDERTRTEIEQLVDDRGITDLIVFHGRLVDDAKWAIYRQADLLLHPTYWDGQPVTILEAFAFGVPVVATCVGAIPDTITSGVDGYLMQENSAAEIVKGVRQIFRDGEAYARFSSGARASYLSRFSATVFGVRMAELLRSFLPARGALAGGERASVVTGADERGLSRCSR